MNDKYQYAVGKFYNPDSVDIDSLKYFKHQDEAERYYLEKIGDGIFYNINYAIFQISNNYIIQVSQLKLITIDGIKIGPVGPIESTVSI